MTGPNRSSAVMQQRAATPDALDYFPTPPWATRALCERLAALGEVPSHQTAWEPCCGEMHMAHPLGEYFAEVRATDVHQYGNNGLCDFLDPYAVAAWPMVDWVITNPPFVAAERIIHQARRVARRGVAMLVRSAFLEGQDRCEALFTDDLPAWQFQFAERVCMLRGRLIETGKPDPFNLDADGAPRKASTATAYTWIVWQPGQHDWRTRIIPPCRRRLERPGDYPAYAEQWALIEGRDQGGLL